MKKFKIVIADYHPIFLKGLKEVLEMNEEFVVHNETVGTLSNLGELKEDGFLSVMQFSIMQNKYPDVIALPDSPVFLHRLFFKFVSAIAKLQVINSMSNIIQTLIREIGLSRSVKHGLC